FDAIDTVAQCLSVFTPMLTTMTIKKDNMRSAAAGGFINATDCADYLVKKGMPFRDAYMIVGKLVSHCISSGETLDSLSIKDYKAISDVFERDIYDAIDLKTCVNGRAAQGGPAEGEVKRQIDELMKFVAAREND
ncbi:MAG: argininosuccinate lyase, partial [Clostridia bacterium]